MKMEKEKLRINYKRYIVKNRGKFTTCENTD